MLFKIQKAFESLNHPGIDTSLLKLGYNAIPYYFNNNYKAHNPLTLYWSINLFARQSLIETKYCYKGII